MMEISNTGYQKSLRAGSNLISRLIFTFYVLYFFTGCTVKEKEKTFVEEAVPVRVMKVERRTIANSLDYVGDIKAQDEVLVYPKVGGKIIEKLKEEGEPVKKGEVIAYIDRDEVGFKFEKAPVESPLTGVIGRINVDIAAQVSPQTAVGLVVDMDSVRIELDIPEGYLPKISAGQAARVSVQAYPGEKFSGAVSRISPVLDLATRSAPIEILILNPAHRLKSGMLARVELVIAEHKDAAVIIKEALLGPAGNEYVYAVRGGRARTQRVKLGLRRGADYEVVSGIEEGELVVVMGQQKLSDGALVTVEDQR